MLFSYVPFGVTVMVLGCPDYLQKTMIKILAQEINLQQVRELIPCFCAEYMSLNRKMRKWGNKTKLKGISENLINQGNI